MSVLRRSSSILRKTAREAAERFVVDTRILKILRRVRRHPGVAILAYHNIVPDGVPRTGDQSLHLPLADFVTQLDILQEAYRVVPLESVLNSEWRPQQPTVAITFDDAYRGALEFGIPELVLRGLPATIFVVTEALGSETAFWWDRLASPDVGGVEAPLRKYALEQLRGENDRVLAWAKARRLPLSSVPDWALPADVSELRRATAHVGIDMGSHTATHANLSTLSDRQVRAELERSAEWLARHGTGAPKLLSYPYGIPPRDVHASSLYGYAGAFKVDGGPMARRQVKSERYLLPRINIPSGITRRGFLLRI